MSEYYKIDYSQDGWPIVTMDGDIIGAKKILHLLNSKTQEIEQLKKENEELKEQSRRLVCGIRAINRRNGHLVPKRVADEDGARYLQRSGWTACILELVKNVEHLVNKG